MEQLSLWGEEFTIKEEDLKKIINKSKAKKIVKEVSLEKKLKSKSVSVEEKMELIEQDVNKILGKYKDDVVTIRDLDEYKSYIDKAIENGIIAIDTETNNTLDTIDGLLMGLCLYTPEMKSAYIPVNHVNKDTEVLLSHQLTCEQIGNELKRLIDNNVKCIYHNASFDIEVIYSNCNVMLPVYWDTLAGAKLLNENELAGLKAQYRLHIDQDQEKYDIEHLFKGLPYAIFKPELFALYAATDTLITYRLYEYQLKEFEKDDNKEIYSVLRDIEIPIIPVIVKMELRGIHVDLEYAKVVSKIFHEKSNEVQKEIDAELERLKPYIDEWKLSSSANIKQMGRTGKLGKSKVEQLSDPIELSSPTQMAILLYDILEVPVVDKKHPRGTGADILEELAPKVKICEILLKKREIDILINTFIDKIPEYVKKDGTLHAKFNSMGTVTGRFSSTNPNLQQIPSHEKSIRMMFVPAQGMSFVGSDYSGQEMRVLASVSNDDAMLEAYKNKQDIYAKVASLVYHNDIEDNLEFRPGTGELQPDGKERRSSAKTVALGLNYGMSVATLAERLGTSIEEAQSVVDGYYGGLKGVKKYTDDSQKMLKEKGYVTDIFGRRRHIPDAQLPEFTITPEKIIAQFNPLIGAIKHEDKALELKIKQYEDRLSKAKWKKDVDNIVSQAKRDGLNVRNNRGFINRSLRQCLNSRIQGSSASMTKMAMILVDKDEELNSYNAHLLVTVHDEMFIECDTKYADKAAKRLCELMIEAAQLKCGNVEWKCDPYICAGDGWYCDECSANIRNDYNKMIKETSSDDAYNKICKKYSMFNKDTLKKICDNTFVLNYDSLKYGPEFYK